MLKKASAQLHRLFPRQRLIHAPFFGGGSLVVGHSTITPRDDYFWDGIKRADPSDDPLWLFQLTLRGWGLLHSRGETYPIREGEAMLVQIPSVHHYTKDPQCREWEFLWIMAKQPECQARLARHPYLKNRVLPVSPRLLLAAVETVLAPLKKGEYFQIEGPFFRWLIELEAHGFTLQHPKEEREQLLDEVRERIHRNMESPPDVEELAATYGMSRSHFAHHFQRLTGTPPATFIRNIRLQEAARLLAETPASIKEIATATGFSNANHFSKAFRQHFQITPYEFRSLPRF